MKRLITSVILLVCVFCAVNTYSSSLIQYLYIYGKFGIQLQSNNDYSKYVGRDVVTMAPPTKEFECEKYKVLTIKKITANDKKITINLIEKDGKKKYKMEAKIGLRVNFWGAYKKGYRIDSKVTVPLLLLDEYNAMKKELDGKELKGESGNVYKVTDIHYNPDFRIVYQSMADNKTYEMNPIYVDNINLIGKIFTHPKVKGFCEIVNISGYNEIKNSPKVGIKYSESMTDIVSEYFLYEAESKCFGNFLKTEYNAILTQVEKPENSNIRYGKTTTIKDSTITKYSYVDNVIEMLMFATSEQFNFVLKNISSSTIKIVWNEAAFIDYTGTTSKVMHSGIKYAQREGDQPASVIIKGAKLDDIACPINNIRYDDTVKKWITAPMLDRTGEIKLMLPIQIKDVINEYVFVFKVKKEWRYPSLIKNEYLNIDE